MSNVKRIPDFCTSENKGADQLHGHRAAGNRAADQRLCLHCIASTIHLLSTSDIPSSLAIQLMSDLVGNPEDRFSCKLRLN